jgi:hypothetical protein
MVDQGVPGGRRPVPTEAWSSVATIDPPRPPAPPGTSTPKPPSGGSGRGGAPWWAVIVAALLAALLAGGGVYAWARGATSTGATKSDQLVLELTQQLQGMQAELTRTKAELDALKKAAATTTTTGAAPQAQPQSDTSTTSKQYTLIKKVYSKSGTWYITADYIQFLTGSAAAAAATAHGDESPPPNDYYVLNENTLLRELPVQAGANVKIMGGEGGDPANPRNQTISAFHDWFISGDTAKNWVKDGIYVLTLSGGKITAIDQQFVP